MTRCSCLTLGTRMFVILEGARNFPSKQERAPIRFTVSAGFGLHAGRGRSRRPQRVYAAVFGLNSKGGTKWIKKSPQRRTHSVDASC